MWPGNTFVFLPPVANSSQAASWRISGKEDKIGKNYCCQYTEVLPPKHLPGQSSPGKKKGQVEVERDE